MGVPKSADYYISLKPGKDNPHRDSRQGSSKSIKTLNYSASSTQGAALTSNGPPDNNLYPRYILLRPSFKFPLKISNPLTLCRLPISYAGSKSPSLVFHSIKLPFLSRTYIEPFSVCCTMNISAASPTCHASGEILPATVTSSSLENKASYVTPPHPGMH